MTATLTTAPLAPTTGPLSRCTTPTTPTGPLRRVLLALEAGADSRAVLARHTGLDVELVDAALAHLVRLGRVRAETLGSGCPSEGCSRCPSGRPDGVPGCLAASPGGSKGLVAVTLVPRQPE